MKFRERHPDYQSYHEGEYAYSSIPEGMIGTLKPFLLRHCDNADSLKGLCQHIASLVPCDAPTNWGWNWLVEDLDDLLFQLSRGRFHKFMDFIQYFVEEWVQSENPEDLEDLNDIFEKYKFGYTIFYGGQGYGGEWNVRQEPTHTTKVIEAAIETVADVLPQARRHLEQAKEHVKKGKDDRSRKDALRDALSAMETTVKFVSGQKDFDDGCKSLQANPLISTKDIAREPNRIWVRIHELYPDVRHGVPAISDISEEEASFWIDRIAAITTFLIRIYRPPNP